MLINLRGLITSLIVASVISLFYFLEMLTPLELSLGYDYTFLLKKKVSSLPNIKVIGIDPKSLEKVGSFPWRRDLYADLIKYLGNNPKVIGFDILLSESSLYPEDDIILAEEIKKSKKIVLPVSLENDPENNSKLAFFFPIQEFLNNSKAVGLVNFTTDDDGIVRKTKIYQDSENKKINIFSYELAKSYLEQSTINLPETIYCNFQGRNEIFSIYPFYDVLSGKVPPETFKDSVVIVGALAEGLQDRLSSPLGTMDGVLYHAQLVSNILNNDYIVPTSKSLNILFIFIVAIYSYFIWKYLETINQVITIIISAILLYGVHYLLFTNNIWINIISIFITNIFTFVSLILAEQLRISSTLKYELDALISSYDKKNLRYKVYINNNNKKEQNANRASNTDRIEKIVEIGNSLTIERTFLETLLNNIRIPIVVTDLNSSIILTNPIAEEFFAKEEAYKKHFKKSTEENDNYNESKEQDLAIKETISKNIKTELINKKMVDLFDAFPEIKSELIKFYSNNSEVATEFEAERTGTIYKIRLFTLSSIQGTPSIICLIEDVTTWHIMANKDGLTNLWNQRYFKDHLKKEVEKSLRYKNPLSLIMMDVDHFKKFNDTYGHQTGDIVLKTIASIVIEEARNTDIPARYGGEEFGIILTMTDEKGAKAFAERLRKKIESTKILDINGNPVRQVTSSLGVCFYTSGSTSDFIEMTDEALYACKDRGRNCCTLYSELKTLKVITTTQINNEMEIEQDDKVSISDT